MSERSRIIADLMRHSSGQDEGNVIRLPAPGLEERIKAFVTMTTIEVTMGLATMRRLKLYSQRLAKIVEEHDPEDLDTALILALHEGLKFDEEMHDVEVDETTGLSMGGFI